MVNATFGKTMQNMSKHRYIKLVAAERRRNYLVAKQKYHTTKFLFMTFNTRIKQNIDAWVLVLSCKTKI